MAKKLKISRIALLIIAIIAIFYPYISDSNDLIILTVNNCNNCENLDLIIKDLKNLKSISKIEYLSEDFVHYSNQYNISKFPALIFFGEPKLKGFRYQDGAQVYETSKLPYYGLEGIVGEVKTVIVWDENCKECILPDLILNTLSNLNIEFDEKTIERKEASELISKYELKRLPSAILSKEIKRYNQEILKLGRWAKDENFVLDDLPPPFLDLKDDEVRGLVNLIYIVDSECVECYDVTVHKKILESISVYINNEKTLELSDAKPLIEKYSIEKIPTIIASTDLSFYDPIAFTWVNVGSIEKDGSFVFRNPETIEGAEFKILK